MIDRLDRQILEIIENAPSIVRSITEREIESGVLFPSVTTMDIKRNLPYNVSVDIIEGRLKALEDEGYIYFEGDRWWLTSKGRSILGKSGEEATLPSPPSRPMRKILEETFSRFEPLSEESPEAGNLQKDFDELLNKRSRAEALLSELKHGYEAGLISEDEYSKMAESLRLKLKEFDFQIENFVRDRRDKLLREITSLEEALAKKKAELESLSRVQSRK